MLDLGFASYFWSPWMAAARSLVIFCASTVSMHASSSNWHQLEQSPWMRDRRESFKEELPFEFFVSIEFATMSETTSPGKDASDWIGTRRFALIEIMRKTLS